MVVRERRWIRVKKFGIAPRARFALHIQAPDFAGPAVTPAPTEP